MTNKKRLTCVIMNILLITKKHGHSINLSSRSKKAKWHLNLYHKKMGLVVSPVTAPIHRQTAKSRIKPNSLSQKIRLRVSPGTAPLNHLLSRTQTNAHDTFINAWQWSVHQELIITDQRCRDVLSFHKITGITLLRYESFTLIWSWVGLSFKVCQSVSDTWPDLHFFNI